MKEKHRNDKEIQHRKGREKTKTGSETSQQDESNYKIKQDINKPNTKTMTGVCHVSQQVEVLLMQQSDTEIELYSFIVQLRPQKQIIQFRLQTPDGSVTASEQNCQNRTFDHFYTSHIHQTHRPDDLWSRRKLQLHIFG